MPVRLPFCTATSVPRSSTRYGSKERSYLARAAAEFKISMDVTVGSTVLVLVVPSRICFGNNLIGWLS